jgi:4-hydroxyphenylpyruvate dioxygenase-like putative hemolysin
MSQAVALDHVGVVGRDLAALAAQYERLGFALTPIALAGGGRIANRCAMLRQGYLELMALAPGGSSATLARMLAHHAGAHVIALAVDNTAAAIARLRLAGIDCPGVEQSERAIDAADPSGPHARFAHLSVPEQPEARINLILHLTPEALWQERFMSHPNHAVALEEVVLAVPAPAESAARFSRLAGRPVVPDRSGGFALILPHGRIRLLPPDAGETASFSVPSIVGITLRTDDARAAITRLLTGAGIPFVVTDHAVTTWHVSSGGVALCFT